VLFKNIMLSTFSLLALAAPWARAAEPVSNLCSSSLPAVDEGFIICAAGAPISLFGDVDAPRFEAVFKSLKAQGFNYFMPIFHISENKASDHFVYFLPPGVLPELPREKTCAGRFNPYLAAQGRLKILFPGFVLVPTEQWSGPMKEADFRKNLSLLLAANSPGGRSVLGGLENFDEPAQSYVLGQYQVPPVRFEMNNVFALAGQVRKQTKAPIFICEAATPTLFKLGWLPKEKERETVNWFWQQARRTAAACDWYGFDVYPVGFGLELTSVGEYVRNAQAIAPGKKIFAALQAFGSKEMGTGEGRRPNAVETRFMAYDAIINGADGVFWWGASSLRGDLSLWSAICGVAGELRRLSGVLTASQFPVKASDAAVELTGRHLSGRYYVIAANTTEKARKFSFTLPQPAAKSTEYSVHDALSGQPLAGGPFGKATAFSSNLPGYGTRVVVITFIE
jgi:hypothetical protein